MGRGRSCAEKHRHASRRDADTALRSLVRATGVDPRRLTTYRCPYCNGWHVGHKKALKRNARRRR